MKTYDTYKDSGIEWIGQIPEHWEVKRVGYYLNFSRGLSITKKNLKDEGIPCVNYGEIHSKYGFCVDPEKHFLKCVDKEYIKTSNKSLLQRGDFVFADTSEDIEGSGNFTCLDSDTPTFAGYHTIILRQNQIDYKFLAYYFDSLEYRNQIRSAVYGIKVYSITQAILKETSLIHPPKSEQTAIANYLDRKTAEIDQLIADKKRLVVLYQEEKTAIINQAVTKGINPDAKLKDSGIEWLGDIPEHWEVKKLKYVVKVSSGEGIKSEKIKPEGDYPVYGGNGILGFTSDFNSNSDDIIIGRVGAKCGNVRLVMKEKWISDNALVAIQTSNDSKEFLTVQLQNMNLNDLANKNAQPLITGTMIKEKLGVFPPKNEQTAIVQHIEKESARINAKITQAEECIKLLTEYRTALISEVVTGKVKVIDN